MRITVNFASQGDETIQLTLNGSFVDAIDTFGAAKKKARAITDELLKPIDIAAWPIKEGQHPPCSPLPRPLPAGTAKRRKRRCAPWQRKGLTAVFAFLGGGIGLHKFYTGNWGWGLIYLALCTPAFP